MDINRGVALITGGASGLGLATARRLLKLGGKVVIVDLPGDQGQAAVEGLGDSATFAPADVTDDKQLTAAFDVADSLGPLRAMVACAGIGIPARILGRDGTIPMDRFTKVVTVNLFGTFNTVRLAAERMIAHEPIDGERGVMVTTASVAAFEGQIGQVSYAASKAAIAGMTLPIARDLADKYIRIVTIAPGLFDTPLLAELPEDVRASLGAQAPHPGRLGDPDEFAALAEHIVCNPMLNGEVIRLDGAIRMAPR